MAKNTLTFELGGRIAIDDLARGTAAFRRLVNGLTPRSAGVAWVVEDLHPGSAVVTLRGEAADPAAVERIVDSYEQVGAALARRETLPHYNARVKKAAAAIGALNSSIEYVRFQTPDNDLTVYRNDGNRATPAPMVSVGAITGRVQTLSNRAGLRFNLYDVVHDKAVACYLAPDQKELIRKAWGRWATVTGLVSREPLTGLPIAVRQIVALETLPEAAPGAYRQARGILPWQPGNPLPEDVIRQMRDA